MMLDDALKSTADALELFLDAALAGPGQLGPAMRHGTLGGGKRLRPFLVMQSAALFGVDPAQALRVAAALEYVHCFSLIHDDLPALDNDDLRRGRPTVHRAFDEATAILAGDGLLAAAFVLLADPATHADGTVRADLVGRLAHATGPHGMVGGQMLDLEAERFPVDMLEEVAHIQSLKTGALIRFACVAGPVMAGADAGDIARLEAYGDALGRAFQIADDILDIDSNPEVLGKATQKDEARHKATVVSLMGLDAARAEAQSLAAQACEILAAYGERAQHLCDVAHYAVNRQS